MSGGCQSGSMETVLLHIIRYQVSGILVKCGEPLAMGYLSGTHKEKKSSIQSKKNKYEINWNKIN